MNPAPIAIATAMLFMVMTLPRSVRSAWPESDLNERRPIAERDRRNAERYSRVGVNTTLAYDLFGNMTSASQGGITQYNVYDGYRNLCKIVRPIPARKRF
jgi:hypothetical protein